MARHDLICANQHLQRDIIIRFGERPDCPECGAATEISWQASAAVAGDEIDILVRHAICNADGTPRRYRSKTELKKAAFEAGWSVEGDTPKPNQRIVEQRHQDAEKAGRNWH